MRLRVLLFLSFIFISGAAYADKRSSGALCAPLLSQFHLLQATPGTSAEESNWAEAFLSLLNLIIGGIDEINFYTHGQVSGEPIKIYLLKKLSSSETPLNPLTEILSQTHFSPTISTITDGGQIDAITEVLTREDWQEVRQFAQQKLALLHATQAKQIVAHPTTQEDFLDLPDEKGETRLFRMIRELRFDDALKIVESPQMNSHYINQFNLEKLTALDILNKHRFTDDRDTPLREALLRKKARLYAELYALNEKVKAAARNNDTATIQEAYDSGLDFSRKIEDVPGLLQTFFIAPVYSAARAGHFEATELLLKLGAPADAFISNEPTPLLFAVNHGHANLTKLLLEHGARIDAGTGPKNRSRAFHYLAQSSSFNAEIVPLLLQYGLDINSPDNFGNTALHLVGKHTSPNSKKIYIEMFKVFLAYGADPTQQNNEGRTALSYLDSSARKALHEEVRKYLPPPHEQFLQQAKEVWSNLRTKLSRRGQP